LCRAATLARRQFRVTIGGTGTDLLILKLIIVPLGLLLLGVVERLHGPRLAGWLSGFPVVAFPLLVFITQQQGVHFGAAVALGGYFGLVPWLAFTKTYAWVSRSSNWVWTSLISFLVWSVLAVGAFALQKGPHWLQILPFIAFVAAVSSYPRGRPSDEEREHVWWGLPVRMAAGAAMTLMITQFSAAMGSQWSGIFTTFPVLGSIIAISNHVQYGRHAVEEAVAGMTTGLAAVGTFCFAAYILLNVTGIGTAFGLALAACFSAHALSWLMFKKPWR
jgi:hypothetical protein